MCNAHNHSPGCNCGWGGGSSGGGYGQGGYSWGRHGWVSNGSSYDWENPRSTFTSTSAPKSQYSGLDAIRGVHDEKLRSSETYKTLCWWCGEEVYYHTNGFGDCVLFDELGWPWPVHRCWEEHRKDQCEKFYARAKTSAELRLAVLIGAAKRVKFLADECSVAAQMGISLEQFRNGYGDLYTVSPYTRSIQIFGTGKSALQNVYAQELRDAETSKTTCRWCSKAAYHHTNGYGDNVLLDDLKWPWLIHECWEEHQTEQCERFYTRAETSVQPRLAILIGAVKQINFLPDECSVAAYMGISIEQLRDGYSDLYTIAPHTKAIRFVSTRRTVGPRPPEKQDKQKQEHKQKPRSKRIQRKRHNKRRRY